MPDNSEQLRQRNVPNIIARLRLLALLVLSGVAACGGADPPRAAASSGTTSAPASAADAGHPEDAAAPGAESQSLDLAVVAGCDSVQVLVREMLHFTPTRTDGPFSFYGGEQRTGCQITGTASFAAVEAMDSTIEPVTGLGWALVSRGWREDIRYEAEGAGSSTMGVRTGQVLCVIHVTWEGADHDEPAPDSAPPRAPQPEDPAYYLTVECVRADSE